MSARESLPQLLLSRMRTYVASRITSRRPRCHVRDHTAAFPEGRQVAGWVLALFFVEEERWPPLLVQRTPAYADCPDQTDSGCRADNKSRSNKLGVCSDKTCRLLVGQTLPRDTSRGLVVLRTSKYATETHPRDQTRVPLVLSPHPRCLPPCESGRPHGSVDA